MDECEGRNLGHDFRETGGGECWRDGIGGDLSRTRMKGRGLLLYCEVMRMYK